MLVAIGQVSFTIHNGLLNVSFKIGDMPITFAASRDVDSGVVSLKVIADQRLLFNGQVGGEHDIAAS
jgi:hypothetical protein